MTEEEKEVIEHSNIIIKEGIDKEDDIQGILKKLLNLIKKQQAEIEKKDKIIYEIAKYIACLDNDETICKKPYSGDLCEDKKNVIFVMVYYHKDLLYKLFTEDERSNDYEKIRKVKELAEEFLREDWDNVDEDLEDTTREFLINKVIQEK